AIVVAVATLSACSAPPATVETDAQATAGATGGMQVAATAGHSQSPTGAAATAGLPGLPPPLDPNHIYAPNPARHGNPNAAKFPQRVYVPNTVSNTVDVIDPATFKVVDHYEVGRQPQHVTPSYDLQHLWVLNDLGDSVTEIDPVTGAKGKTTFVKDPYNMYYTPDAQYAMVVADREQKLNVLNPSTMKLVESVPAPCRGVDHMDFSADGRFLIASCEFAGTLLKVDVATRRTVSTLVLGAGLMPQDVRS